MRILRGFGMTELFRPISYLADEAADFPDAIGRAVPDVELRVVDDAEEACGAGEVGELWIRSPAAMDGYLRAESRRPASSCATDGSGPETSRESPAPASSPSWGGRRS